MTKQAPASSLSVLLKAKERRVNNNKPAAVTDDNVKTASFDSSKPKTKNTSCVQCIEFRREFPVAQIKMLKALNDKFDGRTVTDTINHENDDDDDD